MVDRYLFIRVMVGCILHRDERDTKLWKGILYHPVYQ